jgi:WD40 repeat protein
MRKSVLITTIFLLFVTVLLAQPSIENLKPELVIPAGHSSDITSVEFSPDSKLVITSSYDCTLMWDVETGKIIRQLKGQSCATFNPEGNLISTASDDGSAKIWDVQTGKMLHWLKMTTSQVVSCKFSPYGKYLVTLSLDETAKLWNVQTGSLMASFDAFVSYVNGKNEKYVDPRSLESSSLREVIFSKNGKIFIEARERLPIDGPGEYWSTSIWDMKENKLLKNVSKAIFGSDGQWFCDENESEIIFNDGFLGDTIFNSDSGEVQYTFTTEQLLGCSNRNSNLIAITTRTNFFNRYDTLKIIDLSLRKVLHLLDRTKEYEYNSATFSPNDSLVLASNIDGQIKLYDVHAGKMIRRFEGITRGVKNILFNSDGKWALVKSDSIKIWNVYSGKSVFTLPLKTDSYTYALLSPNGKWVITTEGKNNAKLWDVQKGMMIDSFTGQEMTHSSFFSLNGNLMLTRNEDSGPGNAFNVPGIWDIQAGSFISFLEGRSGDFQTVSFSPDGKGIISVSSEGILKLWEVPKAHVLNTIELDPQEAESANFSPDGKLIVTTSFENMNARIWDFQTGKLIHSLEGHGAEVSSADFSPDSKLIVTASYDSTLRVWDVRKGNLLLSIKGFDREFYARFSPEGKLIATTSSPLKIWNAKTGKLIHQFNDVTDVAFSPDSKLIVTVSVDSTAGIRDVRSGKLLRSFNDVSEAVFSSDGKRIVTLFGETNIKIWEAQSGTLINSFNPTHSICSINLLRNYFVSTNDNRLVFYDLNTGQELLTWVAVGFSDWVVIHPSGLFDASHGAMKEMYFVKGLEVIDFEKLKSRYYEPGLWNKAAGDNKLPLRIPENP